MAPAGDPLPVQCAGGSHRHLCDSVEVECDAHRRHGASESSHEAIVAPPGAGRPPGSRYVELEVNAGVVVQATDLTQVVDDVSPLLSRESGIDPQQVIEPVAR